MENLNSNNLEHIKQETLTKLENYDQKHLIDLYNLIDNQESKSKFLNQLNNVDFELLNKCYKTFLTPSLQYNKVNIITPIESSYKKTDFDNDTNSEFTKIGLNMVSEGRVALLILAGGQGSRLGFNKAKGMYNINMPSNKSLFEYLCNRFLSIQNIAMNMSSKEHKTFTPSLLLIMTSLENHQETIDFFEQNNNFGLSKDNIIFFPQDTIASLDLDGKIICKEPDEIFQAPNGNGGCFIAMKKHKIVEACLERGIEFIHVISIDNPISKPLDPYFVGITFKEGKAGKYQMSAKCVPKRDPSEPIGVFLNVNGKPEMMDYGDMSKEITEMRDENGQLIYRGGNILNYLISVSLLNRILLDQGKYDELISEFHISKKKIPSVILQDGKLCNQTINGIKFELFFNSIFKFSEAEGLLLLEVCRKEEFAPVKNSEESPNDNPKTARQLMTELFSKWFVNAGGIINNPDNLEYLLEISYLISYEGENMSDNPNIPTCIEIDNNNKYFYFK